MITWPIVARRVVHGLAIQPGELIQVRDSAGRPEALLEILLTLELAGAAHYVFVLGYLLPLAAR